MRQIDEPVTPLENGNTYAFPRPVVDGVDSGCGGMTLREYYAGQVIMGILGDSDREFTIVECAELAVETADALLDALDA